MIRPMVFPYYRRLTRAQKRVYDKSDHIASIRLPRTDGVAPLVGEVARALKTENRAKTEEACQRLLAELTAALKVPPVRVRVLAKRPSNDWGELHGLYEPDDEAPAKITVWMRTAQRRQVVAFRTFLRTLIHELCHHLDYEMLRLEETFHTEGFYKRESSLLHQLLRD